MRKIIKWIALVLGIILLLLLLSVAALPFVLPLEKIKDFAVCKISEAIKREVIIEKVSFNLFSGFRLEKLSIGNREGFAKQPFVCADSVDLRYAFWPLFSRQIIIKEIQIVRPKILIEKSSSGELNFTDLISSRKNVRRTEDNAGIEASQPPFSLLVSTFAVKDGKITYRDHASGAKNEAGNLNVRLSGFALALIKPLDLKISANVLYQGKSVPLSLAGKIGINPVKESIRIAPLSLSAAGENAALSVSVSGWKKAPRVDFSISSKKLSLDPFAAIFTVPAGAEKPKPRPGELTKTVNKMTASLPWNLSLNGNVNIENLSFQKFKADKINLVLKMFGKRATLYFKEVRLYDGILSGKAKVNLEASGLGYDLQNFKLVDFNSTPFINALIETFLTSLPDYHDLLDKVYGRLDLSLSLKGQGVEPQEVLSNAVGDGSFTLRGGELKKLKTLASVGEMIKSNTLQQDLRLQVLTAGFSARQRIVSVKGLRLEAQDVKAAFNGSIDLGRLVWVPGNRLTLKLSPSATKDLAKEFSVFRDPQGWIELTFELTGELKKPLPKPILEKPMEVVVGKVKAKIEAQKVEIEQKLDEEKARLQEEAKGKLKDLLKF